MLWGVVKYTIGCLAASLNLYALDADSTQPPVVTMENVFSLHQMFSGWRNDPQLRTADLENGGSVGKGG